MYICICVDVYIYIYRYIGIFVKLYGPYAKFYGTCLEL